MEIKKIIHGKPNHFGIWKVDDNLFYNKRDALLYATKNSCPDVTWHWHDDTWSNFDINTLGKKSLSDLYCLRAQQLRDTYDYLILSYSGGADSHNILMTFLDNKIKLDQIYVHQPFSFLNSTKHNPNSKDKNPRNTVSEWDYCVKPTLEYLSKHHPEIKIDFGDWGDKIKESSYTEDIFLNFEGSNYGPGTMIRDSTYSILGKSILDNGKKVATIYGFDKPMVTTDSNKKVYMVFNDAALTLANNNVGVAEPFYWSASLPELPFEMAYQLYLHYKSNLHLQEFMYMRNSKHPKRLIYEINNDLAKKICYNTWDYRKFQANKPFGIRNDRDFFIFEIPDFSRAKQAWEFHFNEFFKGIDEKYLEPPNFFKINVTRGFYIGDL
jgi:hypothetical protein